MTGFFFRIISNSLALYVAAWLVPGFIIYGGLREYVLGGIVWALLHTLVRPILKLVSLPLIIITLGLFTIVINALMLWTVAYLFTFIAIQGLFALFMATIVISFVNILLSRHP